MHILVTNDDGVHAEGLLALATALRALGDVTVMAPAQNQSAVGHRKTMHKPLRVAEVTLADGSPAFATSGSPSDSVSVALLGFISRQVDLVVSGINSGPNLGQDITYSGTVTAAMEGVIANVPSIAVSLEFGGEQEDYERAANVAVKVARQVTTRGLPPLTLLNVNVPLGEAQGTRITRQGHRIYRDELIERLDPWGRPYYWIGGQRPTGDLEEAGTDLWAMSRGYVSITPIEMSMTAQAMLGKLAHWSWD